MANKKNSPKKNKFHFKTSAPVQNQGFLKKYSFLWLAVLIVFLLLAGAALGIWYFNLRLEKGRTVPFPSMTFPSQDSSDKTSAPNLDEQDISDEIESIEKDLGDTDLSNLDDGLEAIEEELSSE